MAVTSFNRPELPSKNDPEYMGALIDACIGAFEVFQDDTMALDYMGVNGKTRPMVLENEKYKLSTRQLKAEMFLEEIEDVNGIIKSLKEQAPNESQYDIRNPKDASAYTKDFKDTLSLRLKATEQRRELLSISRNKEAEENDALHVFFIALTPTEFEAMTNVEINEGTDDAKMNDGSKKEELQKSAGEDDQQDTKDPFVIGADGSIEEIVEA
jgi:hypothetical protein